MGDIAIRMTTGGKQLKHVLPMHTNRNNFSLLQSRVTQLLKGCTSDAVIGVDD